jgi:hypothetical protein
MHIQTAATAALQSALENHQLVADFSLVKVPANRSIRVVTGVRRAAGLGRERRSEGDRETEGTRDAGAKSGLGTSLP